MELIDAIKSDDIKLVRNILHSKTVNVNAKYRGETALMVASREGNTKIVKLLLEKGANLNIKIIEGWTALMFAIAEGNTRIVKLLLEEGADPNVKDKFGSALMFATEEGHTKIAKLLLTAGADSNIKDRFGYTPLMEATEEGHTKIARLISKSKQIITPKLKKREVNDDSTLFEILNNLDINYDVKGDTITLR